MKIYYFAISAALSAYFAYLGWSGMAITMVVLLFLITA